MKTFFILLFSVPALINFAGAQSRSDKMYETFLNYDGVTNLSFTKNMIDVIDLDLGGNGAGSNVTGDLHQIRFLSYNPKKGNLTGTEFCKKAVALLPSKYKKYDEDDVDSNTEIWLLGRKKKFSECHLFIKNQRDDQMCFVVSFYGDFNVNDLDELKMAGENISK